MNTDERQMSACRMGLIRKGFRTSTFRSEWTRGMSIRTAEPLRFAKTRWRHLTRIRGNPDKHSQYYQLRKRRTRIQLYYTQYNTLKRRKKEKPKQICNSSDSLLLGDLHSRVRRGRRMGNSIVSLLLNTMPFSLFPFSVYSESPK